MRLVVHSYDANLSLLASMVEILSDHDLSVSYQRYSLRLPELCVSLRTQLMAVSRQ